MKIAQALDCVASAHLDDSTGDTEPDMFEGPEYKSYIALCRELRLERKFEDGDWFWWPGTYTYSAGIYCYHWSAEDEYSIPIVGSDRADPKPYPEAWLPRLDQWLDMLEAAHTGVFEIEHCADGYTARGEERAYDFDWSCHATRTEAPTREEAAARLWMALERARV